MFSKQNEKITLEKVSNEKLNTVRPAIIEIQAFWQYIAAILQQQFLEKLRQYCCNVATILDFACKLVSGNIAAILQQQFLTILLQCCNVAAILDFACKLVSGNIAAIPAILPETVCTLMHMYALMESSSSLKY